MFGMLHELNLGCKFSLEQAHSHACELLLYTCQKNANHQTEPQTTKPSQAESENRSLMDNTSTTLAA